MGRDVHLTPRGSGKFPSRERLRQRLTWTGRIFGAVALTASVDAFNVLDSDTALTVQDRWGLYRISSRTWLPRSDFGTPTQIEAPREIRATLRIDFQPGSRRVAGAGGLPPGPGGGLRRNARMLPS